MKEGNEGKIAVIDNTKVVQISPMSLLNTAVEKGASIEQLTMLMDLSDRFERNEARKAYVTAMNAFKSDPPEVFKSAHVSFSTAKGTTEYNHAKLEDAVDAISAGLSKKGLSFRWDCEQLDGGTVKVTCVITHVLGHSERVSLQAGRDDSGGKNNIQALASTVTYLQRYTLFSATGLAAKGIDDDGRKSEIEFITDSQAADLDALLDEVSANKVAFLDYFKIGKIEELPEKAYKQAVALAEAKRKKAK